MLKLINNNYKYGFHCQKLPEISMTIKRVVENTPLSAMQIYISNGRSKSLPKFDYEDLLEARQLIKLYEIYVVIHGCLLYNLAGTLNGESDENYHTSLSSTIAALTAELDYGVMMGNYNNDTIKINSVGVIVHPGSFKGEINVGLMKVVDTINKVLTRKTKESEKICKYLGVTEDEIIKRRRIILENSAGEGTKLCSDLKEIAFIIKNLTNINPKLKDQISVCIDTAHAFGKGLYDWGKSSEIQRFYDDFDRIIGLKYLELFHFNDSMRSESKAKNAPFGSKKDRHQQLGKGYIFDEDNEERFGNIKTFIIEARKRNIKIIGEPPISGELDWELVSEIMKDTKYPLYLCV